MLASPALRKKWSSSAGMRQMTGLLFEFRPTGVKVVDLLLGFFHFEIRRLQLASIAYNLRILYSRALRLELARIVAAITALATKGSGISC